MGVKRRLDQPERTLRLAPSSQGCSRNVDLIYRTAVVRDPYARWGGGECREAPPYLN